MKLERPELRTALAAEYALGTLRGAARHRFERLLGSDPALRSEVESWEASLFQLLDALPDRAPPVSLWRRIENEIGPATTGDVGAGDPGRPLTRSAASFWDSLSFWRGWSFAASVATIVLAVALFLAPSSSPVNYVVIVTDDARSRASWVVIGRADTREIRVRALAPQSLPEARVFQLWVLPAGATKVLPVTLMPADGHAQLTVSESVAAALADAQKLGVSIEPPGGSPTGQPTTTPLYHGTPLEL